MTLGCTGAMSGCYMLNFTEAVMYILYDPKGSYTNGVSFCEDEGLIYSTLDSGLQSQLPETIQEVSIAGTLLDNVWFGLTKNDESKPWKWYDGTDVNDTWFPWGPGQPSLIAYPACAMFDRFDFLWYTEDCASTNYYLCMEDWTTEVVSNVTEVQLSSTEITQPTVQSTEGVESGQHTMPENENEQITFVPFDTMVRSLMINRTSTFKYRYRFKSMDDNRPMSMGIGMTASLVLLLVILTIGILDLSSIIRDLKMLRRNLQSFMGRHSKVTH